MTPKTDSVAVLRALRRGCSGHSGAAEAAALDAAIAALSAQGEAVAWSMFNEAAGRLTTLKSAVLKGLAELACLGEPDHLRSCFKRGHEWREELIERESVVKIIVRVRDSLNTATPLYTAPGGVGDAVTEEEVCIALAAAHKESPEAGKAVFWSFQERAFMRRGLEAALAARTGKGE